MEEILLNIISKYKKGVSKSSILKILEKENIDNLLKKLELEKKIFCNSNGKYVLFPNDLFVGEVLCSHKGNRYVLLNGRKYYIKKEDLSTARDYDLVVYKPDFILENAVVLKVLLRKNDVIVCEVVKNNKKATLVPFNTSTNIRISVNEEELLNYIDGDIVSFKITNEGFLDVVKGSVISKIGNKSDPNIEQISVANNHGFSTVYSDKYLLELSKVKMEVDESDLIGRVDLRDKEIFTIDSSTTKDMDDAVSLEMLDNGNYLLGVHIADVAHYLKDCKEIYNEAYSRGTSLYLIDSVIPMLHRSISNGICSLNPCVSRLTRSVFIELDKSGNIVDYKIEKTVIKSKMKMTYEDVNKIFDGEIIPDYIEHQSTLNKMHLLSLILTKRRINEGYLEFASNDIKVIEEDGNPVEFKRVEQGISENLIEQFMVLANEVVATHINYMSLPFIYRVHERPDEIKLENTIHMLNQLGHRIRIINDLDNQQVLQQVLRKLSGKEEFPILSQLLLRSVPKARYQIDNIGHFALGLNNYTHFTSPIRRLPDLIVHMLLDLYESDLSLIDYDSLEEKLIKAANHASYKERQSELAENEIKRIEMVKYMSNHIGEVFEGVISEISPVEIIVIVNNISISVPIEEIKGQNLTYNPLKHSYKGMGVSYTLGSKINIKIKEVSRELNKIYCSLENNINYNKEKVLKK